jgi:hypothetical protein
MSQLTLRGLDKRLLQHIRELARRERISMNKAALRLLERGAGLAPAQSADCIGSSLDHLIGTWTAAEANKVNDAIKSCEQIDPDLWE